MKIELLPRSRAGRRPWDVLRLSLRTVSVTGAAQGSRQPANRCPTRGCFRHFRPLPKAVMQAIQESMGVPKML